MVVLQANREAPAVPLAAVQGGGGAHCLQETTINRDGKRITTRNHRWTGPAMSRALPAYAPCSAVTGSSPAARRAG